MSNHSRVQMLRQLWSYLGPDSKSVKLGVLYSFLNKLMDIAPEILIGMAIDVVVRKEASFLAELGVEKTAHQLFVLAVLTLLIWGLESLFEYAHLLKWKNLAQLLQHRLRLDAYDHLQRLELSYFESQKTGDLTTVLNDDINQLERFFNVGANEVIQVLSSVLLVGAVFFSISPLIASVSFLPIPVILFGAFYFQRRAGQVYGKVRSTAGELGARLNGNLSAIPTILSYVREETELSELRSRSLNYLEANQKAIRISSAFIPLIRMAILAGFMMTFLVGGFLVLKGELQVGAYGILVFLTQRLLWPLTRVADTVDLFERAMASTRRIFSILETPIRPPLAKGKIQSEMEPDLRFQEVSFAYGSNLVLEDINLEIKFGSTIGLVGPTGSGKSTLVKLMLKFYEPSRGALYWNQINFNEINNQDLRQQIGWVSQETHLIDGTIAENIAYGRIDVRPEQILEAATLSHCMEFIERLPEGMNTRVGERGQKLSGGQRQRIAIARALIKNPPILILDEATSAVDNETEALIKKSLKQISKGRTVILIAHRLSTVVEANEILVLEMGRIASRGTHQELMQKSALYQKLWQRQIQA